MIFFYEPYGLIAGYSPLCIEIVLKLRCFVAIMKLACFAHFRVNLDLNNPARVKYLAFCMSDCTSTIWLQTHYEFIKILK